MPATSVGAGHARDLCRSGPCPRQMLREIAGMARSYRLQSGAWLRELACET
jgi:hypothetical protein